MSKDGKLAQEAGRSASLLLASQVLSQSHKSPKSDGDLHRVAEFGALVIPAVSSVSLQPTLARLLRVFVVIVRNFINPLRMFRERYNINHIYYCSKSGGKRRRARKQEGAKKAEITEVSKRTTPPAWLQPEPCPRFPAYYVFLFFTLNITNILSL